MSASKTIIGLNFTTTDPTFGAPVSFFTVGRVNVDYVGKATQVTLRGFASEDASKRALTPLAYPVIELQGVPDGDPEAWCYAGIAATKGHSMEGAKVVEGTKATERAAP